MNGGGPAPTFCPSMGFDADCPSAAYEFVIESMTDWAFSWPISGKKVSIVFRSLGKGTNVDNSQRHFEGDYDRYCELCARSWSHV